jgi:hypothetical protein
MDPYCSPLVMKSKSACELCGAHHWKRIHTVCSLPEVSTYCAQVDEQQIIDANPDENRCQYAIEKNRVHTGV